MRNLGDEPVGEARPNIGIAILTFLSQSCLVLVLIAAPWLFGGVQTKVQSYLYGAILVALSFWILSAILRAFTTGFETNRLPWSFAFLAAFLVLGAYQLSSRHPVLEPDEIQSRIEAAIEQSSDQLEKRQLAKDSLISSLQSQSGRTISPASTRFAMAKLSFAFLAFFLGTQLFATQKSQMWLWGIIAVNGAALAFFGISQQLSWNGKLYWTVPLRFTGHPFSSFVNRNNAAGFLTICLATALGFLFSMQKKTSTSKHRSTQRDRRQRSIVDRLKTQAAQFFLRIGTLSPVELCAIASVMMIAGGIVAAISRGGWLALAAGTLATCVVAVRSRTFSIVILAGISTCAIASVMMLTGISGEITKRWQTLISVDRITADARLFHWKDSACALRDFPVTGTGLGTYSFAYLPYQSTPRFSHLRFYHADNQFVEWVVESGFVGAGLILLTVLVFVATVVTLLRVPDFREPAGLVGLFALTSQIVSASFDFGPSMPSNMLTFSVLFGSISGRISILASRNLIGWVRWWLVLPPIRPAIILPCFGIVLLVGGTAGWREVKAAAGTHAISRNLPNLDSPKSLEKDDLAERIATLSHAIQAYPDDPDDHLALADLLIYQFRLEEFEAIQRDLPELAAAWALTEPTMIYVQTNIWERAGQLERVDSMIATPSIRSNLTTAYQHLLQAQAACPLTPDVDRKLASLAFVGDPQKRTGAGHLQRALITSPTSPLAFYQIGIMAYFAELTDFSFACLKTSLKLGPEFSLKIHQVVSEKLSLEEELTNVLPESAEVLIQLAEAVPSTDPKHSRSKLVSRALRLLSTPAEGPKEAKRHYLLAKARLLRGETDEAIEELRRALALVPDQLEWRFELIQIVQESKGLLWALREADIARAIIPKNRQLQNLVRKLQSRIANETSNANSSTKDKRP